MIAPASVALVIAAIDDSLHATSFPLTSAPERAHGWQ
jgi:hypothetical protein